MKLERDFDGPDKERQKKLWEGFKNNFNVIHNAGRFIRYPDKRFQDKGIPSPRQYIVWEKLINMIEVENFLKLDMKSISIYDNELLLLKHYGKLMDSYHFSDITFVCGYFWKGKKICRGEMINKLKENINTKNWKLKIHTQDNFLKKDFSEQNKHCKIRCVPYRMDLHYIIIKNFSSKKNTSCSKKGKFDDNEIDTKNSYIILELPHTEKYYFRHYVCFSFEDAKNFPCGKDSLLSFIEQQRKSHLLSRSLPSRFDLAIK